MPNGRFIKNKIEAAIDWESARFTITPTKAALKTLSEEMLSILPKENIEGIYEITEETEEFIREVAE